MKEDWFKHISVALEILNDRITNLQKDVDELKKVVAKKCTCEEKLK